MQQIRESLARPALRSRVQLIALASITTLAAFVRFYHLGDWSFWGDEMFTVGRAQAHYNSLDAILSNTPPNGTWIPVSLIAIAATLNTFGISEWTARVVPALIGIASIPILYLPIKRMLGASIALVAVLLLAVSPWHIYWSQNARFYTALLLFYSLALFSFFLGFEHDRPRHLVLFLIFTYFAASERLLAVFILPVVMGYLLLIVILRYEKPAGFRFRNLILFTLPVIIVGLWLAYNDVILVWSLGSTTFGFVNNNPLWLAGGVVFYIGIPVVCMSILGGWFLLGQKNRAGLLLVLAATVPFVAILLLSLFMYTANRYVFISLASVVILAAVAVRELLRQTKGQATVLATGLLLIMIAGAMGDNLLYFQYQNGNRDNWRSAYETVAAQLVDGDRVVVVYTQLAQYYLADHAAEITPMQAFNPATDVSGNGRIWFLLDLTAPDKAPCVTHWVREHAQLVASYDVNVSARTFPMRVYRYDPAHEAASVGCNRFSQGRSQQTGLVPDTLHFVVAGLEATNMAPVLDDEK